MKVKIIKYKSKWLEDIIDLILEIKVNEEKIRYLKRHDLWTIKKSFLCFYLALDNNNLIGCIGLKKIDNESAMLSRFYVKKEYRRKGIGEKLYQKVLDYAYKHKFKDIYLGVDEVSKSGISFYEKHGFIKIDSGKFISEDDDFTYLKKLELKSGKIKVC